MNRLAITVSVLISSLSHGLSTLTGEAAKSETGSLSETHLCHFHLCSNFKCMMAARYLTYEIPTESQITSRQKWLTDNHQFYIIM